MKSIQNAGKKIHVGLGSEFIYYTVNNVICHIIDVAFNTF